MEVQNYDSQAVFLSEFKNITHSPSVYNWFFHGTHPQDSDLFSSLAPDQRARGYCFDSILFSTSDLAPSQNSPYEPSPVATVPATEQRENSSLFEFQHVVHETLAVGCVYERVEEEEEKMKESGRIVAIIDSKSLLRVMATWMKDGMWMLHAGGHLENGDFISHMYLLKSEAEAIQEATTLDELVVQSKIYTKVSFMCKRQCPFCAQYRVVCECPDSYRIKYLPKVEKEGNTLYEFLHNITALVFQSTLHCSFYVFAGDLTTQVATTNGLLNFDRIENHRVNFTYTQKALEVNKDPRQWTLDYPNKGDGKIIIHLVYRVLYRPFDLMISSGFVKASQLEHSNSPQLQTQTQPQLQPQAQPPPPPPQQQHHQVSSSQPLNLPSPRFELLSLSDASMEPVSVTCLLRYESKDKDPQQKRKRRLPEPAYQPVSPVMLVAGGARAPTTPATTTTPAVSPQILRNSEVSSARSTASAPLGNKEYCCEICGFAFKRKSDLQRHCNTVHTKARPFMCNQCGDSFRFKWNLRSHMECVHYKMKPFSCQMCTSAFGRKGDYKKHLKAVHGISGSLSP